MTGFIQKIFLVASFFLFFSCVATYDAVQQGEALILTDQTKIPCRIIDFDGVDIYFKASRSADAYRFGEFVAIGNVDAIHVTKGGQTLSYDALEYLDEKFSFQDDEAEIPHDSVPSEQRRLEEIVEGETEQPEEESLRLNLEGFMSDSLSRVREKQGIGLNLIERLKPGKTEPPEAYEELAELIVSSGGTGLVLYRAEKYQSSGIELTEAQQRLMDAINNSDSWDERKKSLRSAHKIASEAFVNIDKNELRRTFKFRAAADGDPFIQFLIFLHKQGDLHQRAQFEQAAEVFGNKATGAISDILINFEDWYYIVVIKSEQ
ncbi:MAG: hypothetical protein DWQ05_08395 [Calditrichaeota bacterium]|nr:MAG: hypothetical protein DWQ05_08395 [Calditrichota bacterium]